MDCSHAYLFWILALMTGFSAIATVVTQNIVRSATWLLFTLGGTAGLFFLLGADLVGAVQVLVYVGGTMVLVVFGVMLTAQGPFINMKTSGAEWAISAIVGVLLMATLTIATLVKKEVGPPEGSMTAKYAPKAPMSSDPANSPYTVVIGEGFLGVGVGPAHKDGKSVIRTNYLLPFEIVSVHLLVVLIGAAYLARAKKRRREAPV